jgi:hypothetical protein
MAARRRKRGEIGWDDLTVYPSPGPITILWRWRTELSLVAVGTAVWTMLSSRLGAPATLALVTTILVLVAVVPATRRGVWAHGRCTWARHQLYAAFREVRATTRLGRLPLIIRVHPTATGERALVFCRAGTSVADLRVHTEKLRTACWAGEVRVTSNPRRPQWVVLDLVRDVPPRRPADTDRPPRIPGQRSTSPWDDVDQD